MLKMKNFTQQLFNVPMPEYFEAVSSWLSRLALYQGVSPQQIMSLLGGVPRSDIDRYFCGETLSTLRQLCGLPAQSFLVHNRVMSSLNSMQSAGIGYLLQTGQYKSRFRFCPLCVKEMRTPYLPVHWRFVPWRWCPVHDCLLEEVCSKCGGELYHPIDIADSPAGKNGIAMQNYCFNCASRLSTVSPCFLQSDNERLVSEREEIILRNGRAVLSALYHKKFKISSLSISQKLEKLKNLGEMGILPLNPDWLSKALVQSRRDCLTRENKADFLHCMKFTSMISLPVRKKIHR